MNTLTNLLKDSQIGTWCKRAAWVILVIGLFEGISNVFVLLTPMGFSWPFELNQWLGVLRIGLAPLPGVLFYFFILYAAGAIVNRFVEEDEEDEEAEEDELAVEEDENEITPGQFIEGSQDLD